MDRDDVIEMRKNVKSPIEVRSYAKRGRSVSDDLTIGYFVHCAPIVVFIHYAQRLLYLVWMQGDAV